MAITIQKKSFPTQEPLPVLEETQPKMPEEPAAVPLVSLRTGVLFPHTESVLVFGRPHSQLAIEAAQSGSGYVVIVGQKHDDTDVPLPSQLYKIGTLAKIERTLNHEGEIHALVRGLRRVKVQQFQQIEPFALVTISDLKETVEQTDTFEAELKHLATIFKKTVQSGKSVEFFNFMKLMGGVRSHELVDHVASTLEITTKEKQALLEELDTNKRLKAVISHLSHEQQILNIEQKINTETKKQIDERMRENILRERMQAIQKELGELGDEMEEIEELEDRLNKAKLPKEVQKKVEKELRRLRQMSPMHSEYSYIMSWVEALLELPWSKRSRTRTSLKKAAEILDQDHYGLEKVKERVLEYLAVMKLQQENTKAAAEAKHAEKSTKTDKSKKKGKVSEKTAKRLPTILCFVGPPGVGKTSIGRSIAEALGRDFVKVSLGGVHDEAEIRGHRRTYVGAMPGRIIQTLSHAGTKNPVFILDEIDKVSNDFRGDPASALLEVLDPEQNHAFMDHYLGVPFDLSEVMFIATANVLHTIPGPLRDRLEVVEYTGYTYDEKFNIARKYLVEQTITGAGLKPTQISFTDAALQKIIQQYTREAGVRTLKRELSKVTRKAARQVAEGEKKKIAITPENLEELLGPPKFLSTEVERESEIGLVNGLAWTSVGGEILHIEAALAPGKAGFTITGQLGDVMKESVRAAFTYIRSQVSGLNIPVEMFEKNHVHVHVPEGAVPKDGPSAGIAMTTALASLFLQRPVQHDVAMTGEVTLRGRVLPIGGLKEKLIAAHRAGVKTVFIPEQNVKDLVEIPEKITKDLTIIPVAHVKEVLEKAFVPDKQEK